MADLLIEDRGSVRVLTLNRPEKLNALNTPLTRALFNALHAADATHSVRVVILAGAGRAFCAGADTSEFRSLNPANSAAVDERAALTHDLQALPRRLSKPVVAAAHGVAMGGGAGLVLAADMIVAADDLRFGYPELKHGLVPALVMTGLVRNLGPKLAFDLFGTGRTLSGVELMALNLATAVPAGDVLGRALALAETLAGRPAQAMAEAKRLMHAVSDLPFDQAMERGREANVRMRGFSGGT